MDNVENLEGNNVLFVDDELHILKAIKRGLYKEKFNKFFASSGKEALEIMAKTDIHVIVSDMKMPEMTGLELLAIVKDKYPDAVKIILSGYTQLQQIIVTINTIDIYKFITKPWDMEIEFKEVLHSAINLYNTRKENENLKVSLKKKNDLYTKLLKENDNKMKRMKNDYIFMESLNKALTNFYFILGLKVKNNQITEIRYKEELNFISELHSHVISMMPTTHNEFSIREIQEQLSKYMKVLAKPNVVPSRMNITSNGLTHRYYGDFKIFYFTLTSLIGYYFVNDGYDTFSIVISEKYQELDDENASAEELVELLVLVKSDNNKVIEEQVRLNSIITFYFNLIAAYKGSISFEKKKNEHLILMRFPVEIV